MGRGAVWKVDQQLWTERVSKLIQERRGLKIRLPCAKGWGVCW